ncbi:MAG: choice-of-anchor Q domain-containing protein [Mobilitalea sp.]
MAGLALWLPLCLPGFAADWFVRPGETSYGSASGQSYENAWSGFGKIKWGSIKPGDSLYICDTHVGVALNIGASGIENYPVTMRGDYQGHPGTIIGASAVFSDGWELYDAEQNIWKRTFFPQPHYSDWHAFERPKTSDPVAGIVRLSNVGNRETAGTGEKMNFALWKPGSFYRTGAIIYYKPTNGSANNHIYYAGDSQPCIYSLSKHHFNIMNLNVMMGAGSKYSGVITLQNLHHVNLSGISIKWGMYGIVFSPKWADRYTISSDYVNIAKCIISDCGAGIYPFGMVNHCLITENHVFNIDQFGYYLYWLKDRWRGDIHGIALQGGGDDLRIASNDIHHIGGAGIFPYGDNNPNGVNVTSLKNFSIKYNVVHDIEYRGGTLKPYTPDGNQSALYYNQNNNFPSDGLSDNIIAYNVIYNATYGVRVKCNTNKNTGKAPWGIYNNVIDNVDVGFSWFSTGNVNPNNKPGVVFVNNIVMAPKSKYISIAMPTIKEYDQLIFDNNIYYPAMNKGFEWPNGAGNPEEWRGWDKGVKRDQHSLFADPKFVNAKDHDFRLTTGSPAIDTGQMLEFTEDHDGIPVPQGKAPEIGAFEFPGPE